MVVIFVGRGLLRKELGRPWSDGSSLSRWRVLDALFFFYLHYFWLQSFIRGLRRRDPSLQLERVDLLHHICVVVLFALILMDIVQPVVGRLLLVLDDRLSIVGLPCFGSLVCDRLELREDGVAALRRHRKGGGVLEHALLRAL